MEAARHLQSALSSQSIPTPSLAWLQDLAVTRPHPPPPLASLLATARTRLLAADLTTPDLLDPQYASQHCLPPNLQQSGVATREAKLRRDVVVQVLDMEDLTRSRWEQVEEMEAIARGEGTRGREVVRLPTTTAAAAADGGGDGEGDENQAAGGGQDRQQQQRQEGGKNATHKLVVQDCRGQKVYAIELKRVERIAVGRTFIGEKLLLKAGTTVARGVVMLEPGQCVVLGGKVEAWHRAWAEGRLARLREAVGAKAR
ncbi:hypothetical protein MFIFM68171_07782 [Madurella fahalii]|uniref:RecQ-mediated genome instability protein 1 n=1 Tax=Madurella fahalii TaxID=1157608 RepID=A0ABQ0GII8_9PEZI